MEKYIVINQKTSELANITHTLLEGRAIIEPVGFNGIFFTKDTELYTKDFDKANRVLDIFSSNIAYSSEDWIVKSIEN